MKTYLVRSDDTEFVSLRAKSVRDAATKFAFETDGVTKDNTLFIERGGKTTPMAWFVGGWFDKRVLLKNSQSDV